MMQAHRHWHLGLWLVLGPLMLAVMWLALSLRPEAPVNDTLPAGLTAPDTRASDE